MTQMGTSALFSGASDQSRSFRLLLPDLRRQYSVNARRRRMLRAMPQSAIALCRPSRRPAATIHDLALSTRLWHNF
jgi:hypothetical protein